MKGIILAAGKGTRLLPITKVIPKGLIPVYDRPMIYYCIETLKEGGVDEIIVVTSNEMLELFQDALGDGSEFGVKIKYVTQRDIKGSAVALQDALPFVYNEDVILMFADNIVLSKNVRALIKQGITNLKDEYSSIYTYQVDNPKSFGVVLLDGDLVIDFEEKPENPKSNLASIGLYVLTKDFSEKVGRVRLSARGEYEVADMIKMYVDEKRLKAVRLDDYNSKWYDAGTFDSLLEASNMAKKIKEEI